MTSKQIAAVERMRGGGLSYRKISDVLDIPVSTIKSHCARNGIHKGHMREYELCLCCGRAIIQIEKTKRRKFCCPQCRVKWWNSHPEAVNRKALYRGRCAYCGKRFEAYGNNHRKYCSHKCYIEARFGGDKND